MLKTILSFFVAPKSVATITASLTKTVADLEAHAADQIAKAQQKTIEAAKALKDRAEHEAEHALASKVVQNIKALLG